MPIPSDNKTVTLSLGHLRAALEILQSGPTISQSAIKMMEAKVQEYSGAANDTLIRLDPNESQSWRNPNMVIALAHAADVIRQHPTNQRGTTGKRSPNYLKVVR